MLMAAANSGTRRDLLLWARTLFISFSMSLQCEARPDLVNQAVHKFLLSTLSFQTRWPYLGGLLLSLRTPPGRPAPRPGPRHRDWSGCHRILTTQMLERAWSSAFTRKPPKSESISSPPVLANSTLGSRPTAATMWSVSTWGQKEFSQLLQFPRMPMNPATINHSHKKSQKIGALQKKSSGNSGQKTLSSIS